MWNRTLQWSSEPLHSKLFLTYLFIVIATTAFYSILLVRRLMPFPFRRKITMRDILDGKLSVQMLPEFALKNQISTEISGKDIGELEQCVTPERLRRLQNAGVKFQHLVQTSLAQLVLIERMAVLTILISFWVIAHGAFSTWTEQFINKNVTGYVALLTAAQLLFSRLSLGLGIAAILWGWSAFLKFVLQNRCTKWNYMQSWAERCSANPLRE
jgi:hypothetical protein